MHPPAPCVTSVLTLNQIVQLQHKKLAMTEAALSTDPDAALGKLTVEDVSAIGREQPNREVRVRR